MKIIIRESCIYLNNTLKNGSYLIKQPTYKFIPEIFNVLQINLVLTVRIELILKDN